jgi:hypothetical protein
MSDPAKVASDIFARVGVGDDFDSSSEKERPLDSLIDAIGEKLGLGFETTRGEEKDSRRRFPFLLAIVEVSALYACRSMVCEPPSSIAGLLEVRATTSTRGVT